MPAGLPERIVCLTEETVETLYLLGEERRIVGISHYVVRPARAKREKPRVSSFIKADTPQIVALEPDLVLAFSDVQAEIAAELVKAGLNVHVFNQRSLAEIDASIRLLGAMVGAQARAADLADELMGRVAAARAHAPAVRPRVYFEEWDEPMISAIGWVSELIEAAGGTNVFADRARGRASRERFVTADEVLAARPELILASWCGKKFRPEQLMARPGFAELPAVRAGAVHEIDSAIILQPGPAALTDGLDALVALIGARAAALEADQADAR